MPRGVPWHPGVTLLSQTLQFAFAITFRIEIRDEIHLLRTRITLPRSELGGVNGSEGQAVESLITVRDTQQLSVGKEVMGHFLRRQFSLLRRVCLFLFGVPTAASTSPFLLKITPIGMFQQKFLADVGSVVADPRESPPFPSFFLVNQVVKLPRESVSQHRGA